MVGVPSPQFQSQRVGMVPSGSNEVGWTVHVMFTHDTWKLAVGGESTTVTVTTPSA